MVTGAISGALDPSSKEADEHAERYYGLVRSTSADIDAIAENTNIERQTILAVKNYLFVDEHDLGGALKRFDPNYEISQSWQRLWQGKHILKHDLTLIKHEEYEGELLSTGIPQGRAHIMASRRYNYAQEVRDYYASLDKYRKDK